MVFALSKKKIQPWKKDFQRMSIDSKTGLKHQVPKTSVFLKVSSLSCITLFYFLCSSKDSSSSATKYSTVDFLYL